MKQFIVILRYLVPLEIVDRHVLEHREYLSQGYEQKILLASGPQEPRTGGIFIARAKDRNTMEEFYRRDPFHKNGVAEYQILEWNPIKFQKEFEFWL
ncbi:GTP cyclohydrolase [Leptospira gomenensis]|uniref:GTP cyclohydrolase n=1 Tax=Leptospira gomenensis TaxID=2484974 RepID=A0A5F1YGK4_9LEPT|nr:YciI family protein [Leptospira gomenensis]TGK31541.1 GTP cyclohydrolase [Leptospira gomenensis]TGK44191.1 GTP cyclohydrolase [Leptospira gomenensis]TGK46246.1 GTP cyclohydrolase [Leptospira gomenensis]TGK54771.1 GTP cyclohydrolase [Leptospira gomenensis]